MKNIPPVQKVSCIFLINFALSKLPHFHTAYLVTVCKRMSIAIHLSNVLLPGILTHPKIYLVNFFTLFISTPYSFHFRWWVGWWFPSLCCWNLSTMKLEGKSSCMNILTKFFFCPRWNLLICESRPEFAFASKQDERVRVQYLQ